MKRLLFSLFVIVMLGISIYGQNSPTPKFSAYPATVEKARAKAIDFKKNPDARTFRTRLSEAITRGVNFAGHYIVTGWGCGTGCTNGAIIEARTGDVLWPDQFMNIDATYGNGYSEEQLEFKKNSRLLVIHGVPGSKSENPKPQPSGDYFYEWKNNRFRFLKFVGKATN